MAIKDLRRTFNALLAATGMMPHKADVLSGYDATSTTQLSADQLEEAIGRLRQIESQKRNAAEAPIRKQRSQVLHILTDMGIYANQGDWKRVNAYLLNPRIAGKILYELDSKELDSLIKKLHILRRQRQTKIQNENWLAANN